MSFPSSFAKFWAPAAVVAELLHEDGPEIVRSWAANLPPWISVRQTAGRTTGMEKLQAGEQAAILLAESISADLILLDEKSARRIAVGRGLRMTGTLGVLGEAAARGFLDLSVAVDRLRKTNFRYSPALLKATFDRYGGSGSRGDAE